MRTRRIDFDYKPLRFLVSLYSTGIPTKQVYNRVEDLYTPSYSDGTPLTLRPEVRVQDPDRIIMEKIVNKSLANIKYYINVDGTRKQIVSDGTKYLIFANEDDTNGTLQIKSNVVPLGKSAAIEFEAQYTDPRTNQVCSIRARISLVCDVEALNESMSLDCSSQKYDPLQYDSAINNQPDKLTIKATHRCGTDITPYDADKLKFVWVKLRPDGNFTDVGTSALDYDCAVSGTCGESITVTRSLMAEGVTLKCYAIFSPKGGVASVNATDMTPVETLTFTRGVPSFDYEMIGVPQDLAPGTAVVKPQIKVITNNGTVSNVDDVMEVRWYAGTNKGNEATSFTEIAHQQSATIPCGYIKNDKGMLIGYDVYDRGGKKAFADSDGKVLADSDGTILVG